MALYDYAPAQTQKNPRNPYAMEKDPFAFAGNGAPSAGTAPVSGYAPNSPPAPNLNIGAPNSAAQGGGNMPELNLNSDWTGWRQNPWVLQYQVLPWLQQQLKFAGEMEPQRQNAIRALIQRLSNPETMAAQFRANSMGASRDEGDRTGRLLAAMNPGAGNSLRQGAAADAANRGADRAGAYDAYLQSPEGQQAALSAILQATGMGQELSAMSPYQGLTQTAIGVDDWNLKNDTSRKKSSGLGGLLGGLLGTVTGGGFGNIFGSLFGGGGGGEQPWGEIFGNNV